MNELMARKSPSLAKPFTALLTVVLDAVTHKRLVPRMCPFMVIFDEFGRKRFVAILARVWLVTRMRTLVLCQVALF